MMSKITAKVKLPLDEKFVNIKVIDLTVKVKILIEKLSLK